MNVQQAVFRPVDGCSYREDPSTPRAQARQPGLLVASCVLDRLLAETHRGTQCGVTECPRADAIFSGCEARIGLAITGLDECTTFREQPVMTSLRQAVNRRRQIAGYERNTVGDTRPPR